MKTSETREQQLFLVAGGIILALILGVVVFNMVQKLGKSPRETESVSPRPMVKLAAPVKEDGKRDAWIDAIVPAPVFKSSEEPLPADAVETDTVAPPAKAVDAVIVSPTEEEMAVVSLAEIETAATPPAEVVTAPLVEAVDTTVPPAEAVDAAGEASTDLASSDDLSEVRETSPKPMGSWSPNAAMVEAARQAPPEEEEDELRHTGGNLYPGEMGFTGEPPPYPDGMTSNEPTYPEEVTSLASGYAYPEEVISSDDEYTYPEEVVSSASDEPAYPEEVISSASDEPAYPEEMASIGAYNYSEDVVSTLESLRQKEFDPLTPQTLPTVAPMPSSRNPNASPLDSPPILKSSLMLRSYTSSSNAPISQTQGDSGFRSPSSSLPDDARSPRIAGLPFTQTSVQQSRAVDSKYWVRLASFSNENNALRLMNTLSSILFNGRRLPVSKSNMKVGDKMFYRVQLGPFANYDQADRAVRLAQRRANIKGVIISPRR